MKRIDRFRQKVTERLGSEVKTTTSDDFKNLEIEMQLRQEGMERLHKSMNIYLKSLSKRTEEDKEKPLPIAYLGSVMTTHGEDFEADSEFGQCLQSFGRANERIARMQEGYVASATSTWGEGLERSVTQMKEYQSARKKLESRRLAYDTSQTKMQKSKKEDFRMEEELRSSKAKYEESSEDVYRRMLDIKEAEVDSVTDLTAFLDAELNYYDRVREALVQLKRDWPAGAAPESAGGMRRGPRSRTNTMGSFRGGEEDSLPALLPVRSRVSSTQTSAQNSPMRERAGYDFPTTKPTISRNATFQGPTSIQRDESPASMPRLSRVPTDSSILGGRSQLRPIKSRETSDVFGDDSGDAAQDEYDYRSASPAPSIGSSASRSASAGWARQDQGTAAAARKIAPPPPPSRSKKPPPPLPLKRSALSTSEVPFA